MERIRCSICKNKIFVIVMLLIMFLSYYLSVHYYHQLIAYPKTYRIVCSDGEEKGLTRDEYENIQKSLKEDNTSWRCAFWKEERGQSVENSQWNRSSEVTVWKVRGELEVLFHDFVKLQEDDNEGCYLDENTAKKLFGSSEVVGKSIACGERKLVIRGILRDEKALLVFRPGAEESTDQITLLSVEGGVDAPLSSSPKAFMMSYSIEGDCVETSFLGELLQLFMLAFPAALGMSFFQALHQIPGQKFWQGRRGAILNMVWWLLVIGFVILLLKFIHIPDDMIPDKWSNFSFWSNWWEKERENALIYLGQKKTGKDLIQLQYFCKSLILSILSVFLWTVKEK